jgi:SAM-dependent methyltransferase
LKDQTVFDKYGEINDRRKEFLQNTLEDLIPGYNLKTAMDVGCGVGYFSNFLALMGMDVTAFDGRNENVSEARDRYPHIAFKQYDIEDLRPSELEPCDLVLCFGLLYHLENPFRAIRNLSLLTKKFLIIESMVAPFEQPLAALVDETHSVDQSLNYVALVPSEKALIKMLYKAGFVSVFRAQELPEHEDFKESMSCKRRRGIFIGSKLDVSILNFMKLTEPPAPDIWEKRMGQKAQRFLRILKRSIRANAKSV